jgi:hypothetical protein
MALETVAQTADSATSVEQCPTCGFIAIGDSQNLHVIASIGPADDPADRDPLD